LQYVQDDEAERQWAGLLENLAQVVAGDEYELELLGLAIGSKVRVLGRCFEF